MLIGRVKPSQGTIKIKIAGQQELDIRHDIDQAQTMLGCCAQHDILFDTLTVKQHLTLFFELKQHFSNSGDHLTEKRVDDLIKIVRLDCHKDFQTQSLSGGMKRRLSIALALASPSKNSIVILDEPTTGLDAMVREEVW